MTDLTDRYGLTKDGYRIVPPRKSTAVKGVQCGACGGKFDHGEAYGFVCQRADCPMSPQITFGTTP